MVHQVGPKEWVQLDKDSSWRRMEDSLPDKAGPIRVYGNAIRIDQCPCIISENDGYTL